MEKPCSARRGNRSVLLQVSSFHRAKEQYSIGGVSVEGSMIHQNIDDYLVDLSYCIDSKLFQTRLRTI